MIFKHTNTGLKGAPKWGVNLNKGEKAINLNGGVGDDFYILKGNGKIPIDPKGLEKRKGNPLDLNWIRFHKVDINFKDSEGNDSGKSLVEFRLHSSKKNAEKTKQECDNEFGGTHNRYFVYEGTDKDEQELIDWAINTDQYANDGKTKVFGASKVS